MPLDEAKLKELNKWQTISNVPNLPFSTFDEFRAQIDNNNFFLNGSYPICRELTTFVASVPQKFWILFLTLFPYLLMLGLIAVAVTQKFYLVLVLLPIPIIGHIFGHPMNPLKIVVSTLMVVSFVTMLVTSCISYNFIFWLSCVFFLSALSIRMFYDYALKIVLRKALLSEQFFLFLYERNGVMIVDTRTNEEYWAVGIPKL